LIAGPGGVFICDECVELCREIIGDENEAATTNGAPGRQTLIATTSSASPRESAGAVQGSPEYLERERLQVLRQLLESLREQDDADLQIVALIVELLEDHALRLVALEKARRRATGRKRPEGEQ
jgi:hypothetical protein